MKVGELRGSNLGRGFSFPLFFCIVLRREKRKSVSKQKQNPIKFGELQEGVPVPVNENNPKGVNRVGGVTGRTLETTGRPETQKVISLLG